MGRNSQNCFTDPGCLMPTSVACVVAVEASPRTEALGIAGLVAGIGLFRSFCLFVPRPAWLKPVGEMRKGLGPLILRDLKSHEEPIASCSSGRDSLGHVVVGDASLAHPPCCDRAVGIGWRPQRLFLRDLEQGAIGDAEQFRLAVGSGTFAWLRHYLVHLCMLPTGMRLCTCRELAARRCGGPGHAPPCCGTPCASSFRWAGELGFMGPISAWGLFVVGILVGCREMQHWGLQVAAFSLRRF